MMDVFEHRTDILPEEQRNLWDSLSPCKSLGFVLYGGTAIALRLAHRTSVDFDFFSDIALDILQENKLLSALPFLKKSELIQKEANTRSYLTEDGVKLSFFGAIHLGRVGTPSLTKDKVLQVASLSDLMGTKLAVVTQRVVAKDYKDIVAILNNGMSLENGLGCSLALYKNQFPPSETLKTLIYFEGGDLETLTNREKDVLISAVSQVRIEQLPKVEILSCNLWMRCQ